MDTTNKEVPFECWACGAEFTAEPNNTFPVVCPACQSDDTEETGTE